LLLSTLDTILLAPTIKIKPTTDWIKLAAEDIPAILASGNRTLAGPTVPPGGLYLTRLWYEDERLNG